MNAVEPPLPFEVRKELAERSYEAWGRGDFETLFAIYHPDCEWDNHRQNLPDVPPISRGHAEMAELHRISVGSIPGIFPQLEEITDLPDGRVLIVGTWRTRDQSSGRAAIMAAIPPYGQIAEFRDGLISRVEWFPDPGQARKAAGLAP